MSMTCKTCKHSDRSAIDGLLANEVPLRDIYIYGLRLPGKQFCYVGKSYNPLARFEKHKKDLRMLSHANVRLMKYVLGEVEQLEMIILEITHDHAVEYEWIQSLRKQGHPLQNVILSQAQEKYFIHASHDSIMLKAYLWITSPPFRLNDRLIRSLAILKTDIIDVAEKWPERLTPETRTLIASLATT